MRLIFSLFIALFTAQSISKYCMRILGVVFMALCLPTQVMANQATEILSKAVENWRGTSSVGEMTMVIHRPAWQHSMSMKAWTQGDDLSLVLVTAPAKNTGNSSLINDKEMWSYAPKINRVLKIPSSMMEQSWMGSDFSNKDISRATDILKYYTHTLLSTQEQDDHTVYLIESIPHEDSPIVWGKEMLLIRDDYVLLSQEYYDQSMVLVKIMTTTEIATMGGRVMGKTIRMNSVDKPNEWTQITTNTIKFNVEIPASTFTLSNLRNPRQ